MKLTQTKAKAPPLECQEGALRILEDYRASISSANSSLGYRRLGYITTTFGTRLSGQHDLEAAIDWIAKTMREDNLTHVIKENVTVPRWVRGKEYATLIAPREKNLGILGLGNSIGTPKEGITAEVLVVTSFEELSQNAENARGKIVLYNAPWVSYGVSNAYRTQGAVEAARVGAVAALVRSVTPYSLYSPHTGSMSYNSNVPKIPAAAVTVEDAELLYRMQNLGQKIAVTLYMEAQFYPDAESNNVFGQVAGSLYPEKVVVIGGHIDSWDVGNGALDDAGGVLAAWEAVRILHKLGLKPKRSVRAVGWTNEENGVAGGNAYAKSHARETVFAIESDSGVTQPYGLTVSVVPAALAILRDIGALADSIGAANVTSGGTGTDIDPMVRLGVPGAGLWVDNSKYFYFHHTEADTFDKIDPVEFQKCATTLAIYSYCVANLEHDLPRALIVD